MQRKKRRRCESRRVSRGGLGGHHDLNPRPPGPDVTLHGVCVHLDVCERKRIGEKVVKTIRNFLGCELTIFDEFGMREKQEKKNQFFNVACFTWMCRNVENFV